MATTATKAQATTGLPALQQAFHDTEKSMKGRLVERSEIIRTALLAIASKSHIFYHGEPGTAKSLTIDTLVKHVGDFSHDDYRKKQVNAFMTDADFFGGPDLLAMEQGVWRKAIEHTFVDARIGFADELWRGNDSLFDSLLMYINERQFSTGPDLIDCPLWTFAIAANSFPEGENNEAIADRVHFWHEVPRIREDSNWIQMLKTSMLGPIVPTLTVKEVEAAQEEVAAVEITTEVMEALLQLKKDLSSEEGIEASDRRWAAMLPIIRATAWWRGGTEADVDDMRNIRHALWRTPDQIPTVDTYVMQLASPMEAEALGMRETCDDLERQLHAVLKDSDNPQVRNRKAIELHGKLDQCADEIENLEDRIKAGGRRSEMTDDLRDRVAGMLDTLLNQVFNIDPNAIQK